MAARILVVGDIMVDRYIYGTTTRISPEAPVPVVRVDRASEDRPGGAANVAANVAAMGGQCVLIGAIGDDSNDVVAILKRAGVETDLELVAGWDTTTKARVICRDRHMIRIDRDDELPRPVDLTAALDRQLPAAVVVISDYDKGAVPAPRALIARAHRAGATVIVDPKRKPFSAYRGADIVKPNAAELAAQVGGWSNLDDMVHRARALAVRYDIRTIIVTRGADGLTVIDAGGAHWHVPGRSVALVDETGAGDTVAAALALGVSHRLPVAASAVLANGAAAIAVTKPGTATVSEAELRGGSTGRLVFTNGCFDILHAGHVDYLEKARALGDRLVVGLNDDDSVRRLKGPSRPHNTLERRRRVLAALSCVDEVIAFSDDTPEALIGFLRPAVLVKGGDYRPDQVVGADIVRRYGGEVVVIPVVEAESSSSMISRAFAAR